MTSPLNNTEAPLQQLAPVVPQPMVNVLNPTDESITTIASEPNKSKRKAEDMPEESCVDTKRQKIHASDPEQTSNLILGGDVRSNSEEQAEKSHLAQTQLDQSQPLSLPPQQQQQNEKSVPVEHNEEKDVERMCIEQSYNIEVKRSSEITAVESTEQIIEHTTHREENLTVHENQNNEYNNKHNNTSNAHYDNSNINNDTSKRPRDQESEDEARKRPKHNSEEAQDQFMCIAEPTITKETTTEEPEETTTQTVLEKVSVILCFLFDDFEGNT